MISEEILINSSCQFESACAVLTFVSGWCDLAGANDSILFCLHETWTFWHIGLFEKMQGYWFYCQEGV